MDKEFTVANTQRLTIELMSADDEALLWELDQDPKVMKYINGGKISSLETIQNVMIPRMEKYRNPQKGWGLWKVMIKENNQFIGWVLVRPMEFFSDQPEYSNLELGWRFMQSSWGKGYATEAAKAVMDALIKAFASPGSTDYKIKALSAIAMPDNKASIGIMKKLGMQYVKTYMHNDPLGDIEAIYYTLKV